MVRPCHELNTALATLVGFAELLATCDDEARTQATEGIAQAVCRVCAVVEAIAGEPVDDPLRDDSFQPGDGGRPCVLVIDGHPAERAVLRTALSGENFDVVEAPDTAEALELLDQIDADVVILDWKLPGGGGPKALADLKLGNPDRPVVVLGDGGDPKQRRIATLLDAEHYVARPFNALDVVDRVAEFATRHDAGRNGSRTVRQPS